MSDNIVDQVDRLTKEVEHIRLILDGDPSMPNYVGVVDRLEAMARGLDELLASRPHRLRPLAWTVAMGLVLAAWFLAFYDVRQILGFPWLQTAVFGAFLLIAASVIVYFTAGK